MSESSEPCLVSLCAPFDFLVRLTVMRGSMDLTKTLSLTRWNNERSINVADDIEMGMVLLVPVTAACEQNCSMVLETMYNKLITLKLGGPVVVTEREASVRRLTLAWAIL